ncbi:MAG: SDR family NAD(P)-dependent oxidoreductase [Lachnospiraceae bacterium]|nr:SDR family NAD(P)-dependent oxidoreductase [Lachnospiraceae bacterium]
MKQKYALVTGTDHGVGLALAEELLARGYFVVAARLNPAETQIDELMEKNKDKMAIVQVDIGSDESVAAMKEEVIKLVPQIDLLINDAGILGDMQKVLGDELDFDEMLRVINVNALGALRVTNALVELVLASEDKTVLNISSEAGSIADCWREGWFGYCISKAATNMQSTIVHNNLYKQGGRVIVMHPGHVATYMRGHLDTTAKLTPKESATGILKVALDSGLETAEHPVYVDYKGDTLRW